MQPESLLSGSSPFRPQLQNLEGVALPGLQVPECRERAPRRDNLEPFRGVAPMGGGLPACRRSSPCVSVDPVANHLPAGWRKESPAGSDSEEPGEKPCLRVETKVSVELHLDQQGEHCGQRPPAGERGGQPRPAGAPPSQPPEQRKGACSW